MKKRIAILIGLSLGLLLGSLSHAQQTFTVTGTVYDAEENSPLPKARVLLRGTKRGVLADSAGNFSITTDPSHLELSISFLGYEKKVIQLDGPKDQKVEVYLKINPIEVGQVTILSPKPQVFHHDYRSQVIDYEHLGENLLIVKLNPKNDRPELILVDSYDNLLCTWEGPEPPGKLVTDCLGQVHILGKKYACQLQFEEDHLIWSMDPIADFNAAVAPCLGELDQHYYEKEAEAWQQVLTYYHTHDTLDSLYAFETIINKQKINHLMEEGLLEASADPMEKGPGKMGDIDLDELKKIRGYAAEIQFLKNVLIRPIYAPLKVIAHHVYIFDHQNGQIKVFDPEGAKAKEVPIDYHQKRHWQESLYVDPSRGEAYTQYERNGYITLKEIDLNAGELLSSWDLPMPFATKLTVRDGALFYLCKDPDDQYKKRLYRWVLK